MQRLLILASGLGLMVALYYGTTSDTEKIEASPLLPKPAAPEKKIPEQIVESHLLEENLIRETADNIDPDRDYLLWNKVSDESELQWEKEILVHIRYIDRENSDLLHQYYLSERKNYLKHQDRSLAHSLNELSRLNGESIEDENAYDSPEMRHDEFAMRLKKIFRKQYSYIEDQRKIFIDSHRDN